MSSKKHRNHSRAELMEQRRKDDERRGKTKPVEAVKRSSLDVPAPTVLYNPFRRRSPGGIILVKPNK